MMRIDASVQESNTCPLSKLLAGLRIEADVRQVPEIGPSALRLRAALPNNWFNRFNKVDRSIFGDCGAGRRECIKNSGRGIGDDQSTNGVQSSYAAYITRRHSAKFYANMPFGRCRNYRFRRVYMCDFCSYASFLFRERPPQKPLARFLQRLSVDEGIGARLGTRRTYAIRNDVAWKNNNKISQLLCYTHICA